MRKISEIAKEIKKNWKPVHPAARPYLAAMQYIDNPIEKYGVETGESIVERFLTNAQTWTGETARRLKKELKEIIN